jgi:autotransporter-associated beta strand protein
VIPRITGGYDLLVGGGFGGTNSIELAGGVVFTNRPRGLTNHISGGSLLISGNVSGSTTAEPVTPYLIGTGNTTISGNIVNGGTPTLNFVVQSTGITTLSGTNSYNGTTTVSGGILVFRGTQAKAPGTVSAGAAGSIGLGVGGANSYTSANVAALFGNTLSGFSMNAASGVAVDTTGGNFTVPDNLVAGNRAFTKLGPNTLTLSGANTYAGTTTVAAGTLALVGGSQNSAITVNSGASLGFTLGSPTTSSKAVTLNAGHGIVLTGAVDNASDYKLMTATGFTGIPNLVSPPNHYELQLRASGTELWLAYTGTGGSPYDTWAAQIPDTNQRGRGDDPDGDGFSNGEEFLFGSSPVAGNGSLVTTTTSGGNLTLRWLQRESGSTYTLQQSATLEALSWTTAAQSPALDVNQTGAPTDYDYYTVSIPVGGGKLFYRIMGVEN